VESEVSIKNTLDNFPQIDTTVLSIDNNIAPIKNISVGTITSPITEETKTKYKVISYNSYDDFSDHFKKISALLEKYLVIFLSRQWTVTPSTVRLLLYKDVFTIKTYYEIINTFLQENFVYKQGNKWNGLLELTFDEDNRKLVKISFTNNNNKVPLNIGVLKLLENSTILNKTIVNYILKIEKGGSTATALFGNLSGDLFNSTDEFKKFIISNHYPIINDIVPEPLDLFNCVIDNSTKIRNITRQTPQFIKSALDIRKTQQKNQLKEEGDFFVKTLTDIDSIRDPNFRILFGLEEIPEEERGNIYEVINRVLAAVNLFDVQRFLLEALKCRAIDFDPQKFNELLKNFQKVRGVLEQIALASICNPFLSKGLNVLQSIQIPRLPVYNPNKTLINEIQKIIFNLANDLIVLSIRKLLTDSFKSCLADKNPTFGDNNIAQLENSLDSNDPAVNDILSDFYGPIRNQDNTIDTNAKESAKNILTALLDDFSKCISTKELCDLLSGNTLNDEVYESLLSLVKRKYSNDSNIVNKFNNKETLQRFFISLSSRVNYLPCNDILQYETLIPKNPLCDDGTIDNIRKNLLFDKGLTQELVDNLLNDIKEKEEKNLTDVLKFLDSGLDLNNVPNVLCANGHNPLSMLSPSVDSYKNVINTLFDDVYDSFDKEAESWYKSTYSLSSSSKNFLTFQNGLLVPNTSSLPISFSESDKSGSQEILPQYLFKDLLTNNNIEYTNNNITILNNNINGHKQQVLEIPVIEEKMRSDIVLAEESLKQFLQSFQTTYKTYISVVSGKTISTIVQDISTGDFSINSILNTDIIRLIKLSDAFIRNNILDLANQDELVKIIGVNDDNESNYLLLANEGASVYVALMEFLNNTNTKNSLILLFNEMEDVISSDNRTDTQVSVSNLLLQQYNICLGNYNLVKEKYNVIFKTKNIYPDYDVNLQFNNLNYNLDIKKNKNNYIKVINLQEINSDVEQYINNNLKINTNNKKDIFNVFINNKLQLYNTKKIFNITNDLQTGDSYNIVEYGCINSIKNNILSDKNIFLKTREQNNSTGNQNSISTKQPYTKFIKLVLPQTSKQKSCGIKNNYLDIDKIKNDILQNKGVCIEEIVDDRIANGLPINTKDLKDVAVNETQNAILNGVYELAIRLYLHDVLLRGIGIFGYYDPQSLRNDKLFIDFMANIIESEIRGIDQTFFNMMLKYVEKKYNTIGKQAFKEMVKNEIQKNVLVKLTKRLDDDTNKDLSLLLNETNKVFLTNIFDDYINLNVIKIENNSIFIRTAENNSTSFVKIFESAGDVKQAFRGSVEFSLLFNYLFPLDKYLTYYFINSVLCTNTRKSVLDAFKGTKKKLRDLAKITQTNGQNIEVNPLNLQDVINSDDEFSFEKFIFEALVTTPINIFKAFMEGSEPNIALSTAVYRFGKTVYPELSSAIRPAISLPLGLIPTPLTSLLPFTNPVLSVIYFATGLWYEDDNQNQTNKNTNLINNLANNIDSNISCDESILSSGEKIVTNNDIYEVINKR